MELNYKGFNAWLYRWFYGERFLPKNFCPYFWKLVITYLVLIPFVIICFPYILITIFSKNDRGETQPGEKISMSLFLWLGIWFIQDLILPFVSIFVVFKKDGYFESMSMFGLAFWAIGIIVGIALLFEHLWKKYKKARYLRKYPDSTQEKPKPNLIVEFIKAWYHKNCPSIQWKNVPDEVKSYYEYEPTHYTADNE